MNGWEKQDVQRTKVVAGGGETVFVTHFDCFKPLQAGGYMPSYGCKQSNEALVSLTLNCFETVFISFLYQL